MATVNPFEALTNPNFAKESEVALIGMFSSRIKSSFLKKILNRTLTEHIEILNFFKFGLSHEELAAGTVDSNVDYEVCRNIVAIHRFNCIGLKDQQRSANESSDVYCNKLIGQVITHIRIRAYASMFFRKKRITVEEDYIFYPPAYKLFAICNRARQILLDYKEDDITFLAEIFGKIMSALILIEDGFLANAYPMARAAIEIYLKWLCLSEEPQAKNKYIKLNEFQVQKYCADGENPQGLVDEYYSNAKHQSGILSYMHFGWVDDIPDYEQYVSEKHYSIDGLITYLKKKWIHTENNESFGIYFDTIKALYSRCHAYTHGNISSAKYSLVEFIDLSMMLTMVGRHTFFVLCEKASAKPSVIIEELGLEINLLSAIDEDLNKLDWIAQNKSTEMFETFHNYKK